MIFKPSPVEVLNLHQLVSCGTIHNAYNSGEYGIVYKGFLAKNLGGIVTELVAIKTLKGKSILIFIADNYLGVLIFITFMVDVAATNVSTHKTPTVSN